MYLYIYGALWGPRVPIYGALWGPRVPGLMDPGLRDPGLRDPGPRAPGLRDPGPRVPGLRDPGTQGGPGNPDTDQKTLHKWSPRWNASWH